ncbi:MAG: translation initiation factor IF-2 N-terminal domain-containing protein [Thermodesulfobacteriota bacterium]|nr:translation initiation factor IF-2 N-terminal domain-containing protein [Thermodesulfobacteriota bacterium]
MAKVRVYELARELNMESKNLVEKLKSGGMNIKNYMSTLDNEAIIRARDIVSGTVSEIIEEKRIKPTVIRRRKKTVKVGEKEPLLKQDDEAKKVVEVEPIESVQHQEERMKSFKPDLQKVEKETKKEDEKVEKKQISEDVPAEEMKSIPDKPKSLEPPAEKKPKQKVKKPKKKRADRPAKIIKRPEEGPLKEVIANKKKEEARTDKLVLESIPPQEETPAIEEKKERPAKKKKGKKGFGKKEEMSVRVIRHRRVEVFEKADLYTGRAPKRKEKRGAKKAGETIKDLK